MISKIMVSMMAVKTAQENFGYQTASPQKSEKMYVVPGYQLITYTPPEVGRIAQQILSRAVNEKWPMPSDLSFIFDGKKYIAQYQIHGKNRDHTGNHPGVSIYEKESGTVNPSIDNLSDAQTNKVRTKISENSILQAIKNEWPSVFGQNPTMQQVITVYGQLAMETGHGNECYNYNVGNINWTHGFPGKFYTTKDSDSINGDPAKRHWFQAKMRSYNSLDDGVKDYLYWVKNHKGAAQAAMAGDPKAFSHALAAAGYYDPHMRDDFIDANGKKQMGNTSGALSIYNNLMKKNDAGKLNINEIPQENASTGNSTIDNMIATIIKALESAASNENTLSIVVKADDISTKLEYARILSMVLKEELYMPTRTYTNKNDVEVRCQDEASFGMIKAVANDVARMFSKAVKNEVSTVITKTSKIEYQELDLKTAELHFRKFRIQIYGKKR